MLLLSAMTQVAFPHADTILEALVTHAGARPVGLAFAIDQGEQATWRGLLDDVIRLAGRLSASGVEPGQVCGLQLPTGLDAIRLIFSLQWIGAVPVLLNPALSAQTVARRLVPLGCRRVFVQEAGGVVAGSEPGGSDVLEAVSVRQLPAQSAPAPPSPACDSGDVAYLQPTSGTTGEPRAAAITHRSLMAQLRALGELHHINDRDVLVSWMPLHHDFGLVHFVFAPVYFGRPAHLLQPALSNVRAWLSTISRVRGTLTASPDFGYRLAARAVESGGLDLSSLRVAVNGGEPVRETTAEVFERRFSVPGVMRPGYGLGEATLAVASLPAGLPLRTDAAGNVSCGPPLLGIEVRIAGADGRVLGPGETGEILVRGQTVFAGYWRDPAATREVLKDGWLWTGDLGSVDADGHLYVSGRRRAMIKRAGALVPARAVEELVDDVDGVRLSAAIGCPDESGNEDVVVIAEAARKLIHSPGERAALERAIEVRVRQALGFPPHAVVLVIPKSIPRSDNGKVRHMALRELYLSGRLAAAPD